MCILLWYRKSSLMRFLLIYLACQIGIVTTANSVELKLATETIRSLNQKGLPYIECAFSKLEHSYKITYMPWARAQFSTKHGLYDGFFMASRNNKRDEYAVLSEPFFNIEWLYIVTKKSRVSPESPGFFQSNFAANMGSARYSWLIDKYENDKITNVIVATPDAFSSLKMLALGRVDVILENNMNFETAYKKIGYAPTEFKTFVAKSISVGVYFSKSFLDSNPVFLNKFNASIRDCKNM